jgi:large subunit ribosomal protein L29
MKAKDLRDQTREELVQVCEEAAKRIFDLKAKKGLGEAAEHPLKIRLLRRDFARIKTVLREQELKKNG